VITGHHRYLAWIAKLLQPRPRLDEFPGQAEVGEVARDQQLFHRVDLQVMLQRGQYFPSMLEAAFAAPGEIPQQPFVQQLPATDSIQGRQVGVGNMRKICLHTVAFSPGE
jgi:hypothetical protein